MKAILVTMRADIARRPLQTGVVLLLTLLAGAMASGSLTTTTMRYDAYDAASERLAGPNLLFGWDAERVGPAQIMATGRVDGITATGLVHPTALLPVERGHDRFVLEFVGRDSAEEAVDRYQLIAGRWPKRPGEIAVTYLGRPDSVWLNPRIGESLSVLSRADRPSFVVVGQAVGMSQDTNHTFRAFVRSDQVAPLTDGDAYRMGYDLAYRVERPDTEASLAGYASAIRAALPAGAETAPLVTSLAQRREETWMAELAGPQLVFAVLVMIAAALIIGTVITGSILASQREIGIMQAVGFSRRQVALVMAGQAMVPALIGAAIGIPIGLLVSASTLADAGPATVMTPPNPLSPVLDLAIIGVIVLVVGLAAAVSARHAGTADVARVISRGTAPTVASDGFLVRALRSIPLPRPVRLGIGDAFLRPLRGLITIAVLVVGIAAMTFAVGVQGLIGAAASEKAAYSASYELTVERYGPLSDAQVSAALDADADVAAVVGVREMAMTIDGLAQPVRATAMRGDAASLDYLASAGRWFDGPGEAVMAGGTMKDAGVRIGDMVTGSVDGRPIRLRIVGRYHDFREYDDHGIRFDWTTYQGIAHGAAPREYLVGLRPGAHASELASRLQDAHPHFLRAAFNQKVAEWARFGPLVSSFVGFPSFVLLLIGALAVFNTILLNTTERGFDHAVVKAIGMSPRQVIAMAAAPAVVIGVLGIGVGLPLGASLYRVLLDAIANAGVDFNQVISTGGLAPLAMIAIAAVAMVAALAGAVAPAWWAARRPVVDALRAE
jgi:putative ABC transport system permease protein